MPDDLKTKYERVKAERGNKDEFIYAYAYNGGVEKKLKCLAKLANILAKFSDKNIVYGDLSPENIYISKDKESHESWLIDLDNLSLASEIEKPVGTPKYMAPEVFKKNVNTNYSDEYSFAIIANANIICIASTRLWKPFQMILGTVRNVRRSSIKSISTRTGTSRSLCNL